MKRAVGARENLVDTIPGALPAGWYELGLWPKKVSAVAWVRDDFEGGKEVWIYRQEGGVVLLRRRPEEEIRLTFLPAGCTKLQEGTNGCSNCATGNCKERR